LSISTGSIGSEGRPAHHKEIEAPLIPAGRLLPFLVVTALFFLWAVPANLNDILIRQFMKSFNINRSSAAGVQMYFYLGYFLLAIPAGQLMRRFGYKTGIVTGLVLLGSGCWMFWPAAQAERYGLFLAALFVIASGLSFLETATGALGVERSPAELFPGLLSPGSDYRGSGGDRLYFLGCEADRCAGRGDAGGGNLPGISSF
jgi:FHS family L-fucose permease-like MFS transporter